MLVEVVLDLHSPRLLAFDCVRASVDHHVSIVSLLLLLHLLLMVLGYFAKVSFVFYITDDYGSPALVLYICVVESSSVRRLVEVDLVLLIYRTSLGAEEVVLSHAHLVDFRLSEASTVVSIVVNW